MLPLKKPPCARCGAGGRGSCRALGRASCREGKGVRITTLTLKGGGRNALLHSGNFIKMAGNNKEDRDDRRTNWVETKESRYFLD